MQRITGYSIYWLGTSLGALSAQWVGGATYGAVAQQASFAKAALDFFTNAEIVPLRGSKEVARNIAAFLDRVLQPQFQQSHSASPITAEDLHGLTTILTHFGSVLISEQGQANTFFIATVRGWDMSILISNAERVLSERVTARLSEQIRRDLQECGKCLAFDVPTAATFHLFRAIEAVVLLYFPVLGIPIPEEKSRSLGVYINLLEGKKGKDDRIVVILRHIKDEYRNRLIHPGDFLDVDTAANLFSLGASVIDLMINDMDASKGRDEKGEA